MANRGRFDGAWFKNAAGLYVQGEPTDATLMAGATTGDVLTVKSDDTVHPRTITGAGGIAITVNADDIEVDGSAISSGGSAVLYDSGALGSPAATLDTGASGIASGFDILEIWIIARTDQAVAQSATNLTFNADTGANYDRQFDRGADTTASAGGTAGGNALGMLTAGTSTDTGVFSIYRVTVPFYTETTAHKVCEITDGSADSVAADRRVNVQVGRWRSTAAITRVTFTAPGGQNFAAGSHMICYGR
jgi:hypothetical protein